MLGPCLIAEGRDILLSQGLDTALERTWSALPAEVSHHAQCLAAVQVQAYIHSEIQEGYMNGVQGQPSADIELKLAMA